MEIRTYTVEGMTCGHCDPAIMSEVVKLPGVTQVDVNLSSATLTVVGDDVSDDAVAGAVADAGYSASPSALTHPSSDAPDIR